jgi:drug/metabolite transporter (DMT)-like permease
MVLNFYRVFFGFLFLLLVLPIIDKKTFRISTKDTITSAFIGLIMAVSISLYTTANLYAPVQNVVLINYSYPFFLLFFAYFLLKEKITHTKIITLIIAII